MIISWMVYVPFASDLILQGHGGENDGMDRCKLLNCNTKIG